MKFYNPFKPHVVTYKKKFLVRRFRLFLFEYLDNNDNYWWLGLNSYAAKFDTKEDAWQHYLDLRVIKV